MDARELETMLRLERTFMPYASGRREEMQKEGRRFVHYTSAENAIRIIQSKQIWMRNAKCMTDYMEILHGHQLLVQFFSQPEKRDSFYQALNGCHDGIGEEAIKLFDEWWANIQFNTYIGCISEHEESENQHGRLSMWRAFGRLPARAAIVLKVPPPGDTEGLHVALSPVAYFDYPKVEQQILAVINNIKENSEFLQSLNKDRVRNTVFYTLLTTAVSLKHEGFSEEKEWRIIYVPQLNPSTLISRSIEIIDSIPQVVHKICLEDSVSDEVIGITIPSLVERIIIGPTAYPNPIYSAFVTVLEDAGVVDAGSKVVFSGIPLRP